MTNEDDAKLADAWDRGNAAAKDDAWRGYPGDFSTNPYRMGERHEPKPEREPLRARIQQLIDNQQSWIDAGRSGQAISRDAVRDSLQRVLDETEPVAPQPSESERDAATAAIKRVRAIVSGLQYTGPEDAERTPTMHVLDGLHRDLSAALDGAPEPEWEYSVGFNDPEYGWINDNADIHDNYGDARSDYSEPNWLVEDRVVRRRKAGPWFPVEGEKP